MAGKATAFRLLIDELMRNSELNQKQVAATMGVGAPAVNRLLNKKSFEKVSVGDLMKLANAMRLLPVEKSALLLTAAGIPMGQELKAYWMLLSHTLYLENIALHEREKTAVAFAIVNDPSLLGNWTGTEVIFLDSGSTVTAIARAIVERKRKFGNNMHTGDLITNNLAAGIFLAANGIGSWLVGGRMEINNAFEAYSALLGAEASRSLRSIGRQVSTTVLSTTALTWEDGIHSRSLENEKFKAQVLSLTLRERKRLLVVTDYSKLIDKSNVDTPVLSRQAWHKWLDDEKMVVIVGGTPTEADASERFDREVEKFRSKLGSRLIHLETSNAMSK